MVVLHSGRVDARIERAMEELAALGAVHPSRLADDTIELRPAPAPPELSRKVNEIFARAGLRELRPWIWGVAEADKPDSPSFVGPRPNQPGVRSPSGWSRWPIPRLSGMTLQLPDMRMSRIDVDDDTWRAFRAMCIEQGVEARALLGQLVRDATHAFNQSQLQPARKSGSGPGRPASPPPEDG